MLQLFSTENGLELWTSGRKKRGCSSKSLKMLGASRQKFSATTSHQSPLDNTADSMKPILKPQALYQHGDLVSEMTNLDDKGGNASTISTSSKSRVRGRNVEFDRLILALVKFIAALVVTSDRNSQASDDKMASSNSCEESSSVDNDMDDQRSNKDAAVNQNMNKGPRGSIVNAPIILRGRRRYLRVSPKHHGCYRLNTDEVFKCVPPISMTYNINIDVKSAPIHCLHEKASCMCKSKYGNELLIPAPSYEQSNVENLTKSFDNSPDLVIQNNHDIPGKSERNSLLFSWYKYTSNSHQDLFNVSQNTQKFSVCFPSEFRDSPNQIVRSDSRQQTEISGPNKVWIIDYGPVVNLSPCSA